MDTSSSSSVLGKNSGAEIQYLDNSPKQTNYTKICLIASAIIVLIGGFAAAGLLFPHIGYSSLALGGAGLLIALGLTGIALKCVSSKSNQPARAVNQPARAVNQPARAVSLVDLFGSQERIDSFPTVTDFVESIRIDTDNVLPALRKARAPIIKGKFGKGDLFIAVRITCGPSEEGYFLFLQGGWDTNKDKFYVTHSKHYGMRKFPFDVLMGKNNFDKDRQNWLRKLLSGEKCDQLTCIPAETPTKDLELEQFLQEEAPLGIFQLWNPKS